MKNEITTYFNALVSRIINKEKIYLRVGVVISVDGFKCTYKDPNESNQIDLEALISPVGANTESFIQMPKVGSVIIVGFSNKYDSHVLFCEKSTKIYINCDEILINGGDNDGLALTKKLAEKYNNLENAFNNHIIAYNAFITLYNTHVHPVQALPNPVPVQIPTAPTVSSGSPDTQVLVLTNQAEISNSKVKH